MFACTIVISDSDQDLFLLPSPKVQMHIFTSLWLYSIFVISQKYNDILLEMKNMHLSF